MNLLMFFLLFNVYTNHDFNNHDVAAKELNMNKNNYAVAENIEQSEIEYKQPLSDDLLCFAATAKTEEDFGIEKHLLSTIASVESGKWDYKRKQYTAWPWTVNAQGKGYYLHSREEAVAKVKELQAEGVESIDVGCMQINLKYHSNAFASIEDAFDPQKNVEYSAKFLRKLYSTRGEDWDRAVMAYHSKDPTRGESYKVRINSRYEQIKIAFNAKENELF